jgi:hypothetical protein
MGTEAFNEIYSRLRTILMTYVPPLYLATGLVLTGGDPMWGVAKRAARKATGA